MSTDLLTLARRAVTCKRWRWMDGMQVVHTPKHDGQTGYYLRLSQDGYVPAENEYPDLRDPATLGCLLALVREAWNNPTATTARSHPFSGGRPWVVGISMRAFFGQTEAEALVVALEEAR